MLLYLIYKYNNLKLLNIDILFNYIVIIIIILNNLILYIYILLFILIY